MIIDEKAETLERAGLYRRASARWLEVFDRSMSEKERDWIRQRRNACLRRKIPKTLVIDVFADIRREASEAQEKMGITLA